MPVVQAQEMLVAAMQDVRPLAAILRGVSFSTRATLVISEAGIQVKVEEQRSLLACAYLFRAMFSEWRYNPPDYAEEGEERFDPTFEIQLPLLLQALDIFGGAGGTAQQASSGVGKNKRRNGHGGMDDDWEGGRADRQYEESVDRKATAVRITYAGKGTPLTLRLAGDTPSVTTLCELVTFDPDAQLDLPFDADETAIKIIMKSSWLREALSELDPTCDKLSITCTPPQNTQATNGNRRGKEQAPRPTFRLKGTGTLGSTVMDYPNDRDVLELFESAVEGPISFTYRFHHISRTLRALQHSVKTSIRMNLEGLLVLQFMMAPNRASAGRKNEAVKEFGSDNFIEFTCMALADEE